MRKSFVAFLLLVGAAATLTTAAFADVSEFSSDTPAKLTNARMAQEGMSMSSRLRTSGPGDTTYVGFSPLAGGANYWSIGVGANRGYSAAPGDHGYWDWDNPVHGDSLQGWWPYRQLWNQAAGAGANVPDDVRPWWAIDHGNQVNYVINQGAAHKRTFGVTGVWHSDPGGDGTDLAGPPAGTNPKKPNWAPLGGSRSAWCGLRSHGDNTEVDPITGNPYNVNAQEYVFTNGVGIGTGTSRSFPGYAGQWDQMLYRDIDLTGAAGPNVVITFKVRTRMSDQAGTATATRTGWFDKDPLAVVAGNFIKSSGNPAPVADSFMVYVGKPVEPDGDNTNSNDYVASDGLSYDVYDAQRRWFSEVVRTEGGSAANTHHELFTTYGNRDSTASVSIPLASLTPYGTKARLVFRIKTNRGFDDEGGSNAGAYSSNGAGAAQVDDITVNTGGGAVVFGNFESASDIDNSTGTPATAKWKSTGKPPAVFWHVRKLSEVVYQDLCGAPGSKYRICNMDGNVISMGDFDRSEENSGVFGTPEQEHFNGMMSPTINLKVGAGANNMGLTAATANPTEDYYITYEMYTGVFDIFTQGCGWQFGFQSYPATQADGQRCWGEIRQPGFQYFNPDKQCFIQLDAGRANALVRTSNAGLYPDSMRIGFRKLVQCYRFSISANCAPALGAYIDNVSLTLVNGGGAAPISVDIWQLFNDTFPANENSVLPGTAAFDTCAGLVKSGINIAQGTGSAVTRYSIPGDSIQFNVDGLNVRADLVFRINPGPGNYVVAGSPASGLRVVPTSPTVITAGDGSFWTSYILNNGTKGTPGGHPAGAHATRWSSLVWNSARCDTSEANTFPVEARNLNSVLTSGAFMTMYHEADLAGPRASLAVSRNWCFLNDVAVTAPITAIHCNTAKDLARFGAYPPAWVVATQATNGWNGSLFTTENTKILPDGLFTPGTHVQYFLRREDLNNATVDYAPDSNFVSPQNSEGSTDGHRWQQFGVLPDAWKKTAYGGLGQACMLYVDWNDRRGDERVWVSISDSIGATAASKFGAHNGWHQAASVSVNDASGFVRNLNQQPGTTWDMYGIKASESLNTGVASLGARLSYRVTSATNLIDGQWAMNAPTLNMLEAYYRILLILTGDLNSGIFGPFTDRSADDIGIIQSYLLGATSGSVRGVFMQGNGLVESFAPDPWLDLFGVDLAATGYQSLSGNINPCIDLFPQAVITTSGDIYGINNACTFTNDVYLTTGPDAVPSLTYPNFGNPLNWPYIAGVYKDAIAPNYWKSIVDGFDVTALRSRFCDADLGRLAYFYRVYSNIFSSICAIQGSPTVTLDTPNNDNGKTFVDFMTVRGNPLVKGSAVIAFGLPVQDRVSLKVFDVSGRLVRTLADGQLYKAGEHKLMWDGVDNHGRQVSRGVYFASYTTERGVSKSSKITVVLQ